VTFTCLDNIVQGDLTFNLSKDTNYTRNCRKSNKPKPNPFVKDNSEVTEVLDKQGVGGVAIIDGCGWTIFSVSFGCL